MMLELDWSYTPTCEQYAVLRQVIPTLPEWKEAEKDMPWNARHSEHIVDMDLAYNLLAEIGAGVKLKPFKNNLLLAVNDRFKDLERKLLLVDAKIQHNGQLMQVHVPNAKLIEFNEVDYHEDMCTDQLQQLLNEGWRIIAVCPPLEARRPTYIVGRHNEELRK
jgi:hypothetical protein